MSSPFKELQQFHKLIYAEACLSDDAAQRASVQFFVIRDNYLSEWFIPAQNDVASFLSLEIEANFAQRFGAIPARDSRQRAHTATSSVSKCSSGTGKPSSSSAAMYPRIASLIWQSLLPLFCPD